MSEVDRRVFLKGAAATTGGVLIGGALQALLESAVGAAPLGKPTVLGPVADLRDGKVRLNLPPGFQYRSFHDTDTAPDAVTPAPPVLLDDGTRLPGRHDGMAAFKAQHGNIWLVRNHEVNGTSPTAVAFGPGVPYDAKALGGTTTILVTRRGEVLEAWTSLNGTQNNCAGGAMPWDSWITCEETVNGPDVFDDFNRNIPTPSPPTTYIANRRLLRPHGFIFEVPAGGQSDRVPILHAGRFAHEAAAWSPHEEMLYLTEDNFAFPSGLYRYIPPNAPKRNGGRLEDGGRLQMLKVVGIDEAHLEGTQTRGTTYPVEWVEIDEPFPGTDGTFPMNGGLPTTTNDQALVFVGAQGRARGAAHFSRLEGAKFTREEIYFTSTQGGGLAETVPQDDLGGYGNGAGQVWSYHPRTSTLTCRYQSPGTATLELPDNITAKSDNGTIILCEDGPVENYIRGLDSKGQLFDIALNQLRRNHDSAPRFAEEFAGATFGQQTLFVNIQASAGITFAIWGPWGRIGV